MAATLTLANSSPNRLLYLLVHTAAEASSIPNAAGASPDLRTDAQGIIKQIVNVQAAGYGTLAPGAVTQAQARSLLLNDGTVGKPQARVLTTGRAGGNFVIDANQSGGNPILTATSDAAATCYIEIIVDAGIG